MSIATCPRCQQSMSVEFPVERVQCPHCQAVVVPTQDPLARPGSIAPPRARPPLKWPVLRRSTLVGTTTAFLALLFFVCALGSCAVGLSHRGYWHGGYANRFQNDNAVGATANAVEYLANERGPHFGSPDTFFLAALMCVLIWNVQRLRVDLARRAGEDD